VDQVQASNDSLWSQVTEKCAKSLATWASPEAVRDSPSRSQVVVLRGALPAHVHSQLIYDEHRQAEAAIRHKASRKTADYCAAA
jgi:hypothetical protein